MIKQLETLSSNPKAPLVEQRTEQDVKNSAAAIKAIQNYVKEIEPKLVEKYTTRGKLSKVGAARIALYKKQVNILLPKVDKLVDKWNSIKRQ